MDQCASQIEGNFIPRVLRAKDAPAYLGMDRNKFNKIVKPKLVSVKFGSHSVAYDRLDLDAWWEQYKSCYGQPGADISKKGNQLWPKKEVSQVYSLEKASGMSIKLSTVNDFAKALERVTSKKQK